MKIRELSDNDLTTELEKLRSIGYRNFSDSQLKLWGKLINEIEKRGGSVMSTTTAIHSGGHYGHVYGSRFGKY